MLNDIAPEMAEKISKLFRKNMENDGTLQDILKNIRAGKVDPEAMAHAAEHVGESASRALRSVITPDALPDGQMYYNIATRTIQPELRAVYEEINGICIDAQKIANETAGIGMNPVNARFNQSRIDGIINRLCAEPLKDVEWILDEPIINYSQNVHNDFVRENAKFQRSAGLKPRITRKVYGNCCDWCEGLAGTYDYGSEPSNFYRMHENCRCVVIFEPAKGDKRGRYQDAHSKQWYDDSGSLIENRKTRVNNAKAAEKKDAAKAKEDARIRRMEAKRQKDIQPDTRTELAKEMDEVYDDIMRKRKYSRTGIGA